MVSSCIVPRCKRKRRTGLSYYRFPVKDAERCKLWLRAVNNPKYDENTSIDCLKNHRVCSLHFKPEDFQRHLVWDEMGGDGVKKLRPTAVPSLNLGEGETCTNAEHSPGLVNTSGTAAQAFVSVGSGPSVTRVLPWTSVITSGPSTSSQASSVDIQYTSLDLGSTFPSRPLPSSSGPPDNSQQSPSPAEPSESLCSVSSVDYMNESIHQETEFELRSTTASKSEENTENDLSQLKTIVNDSCLMELFKKCQTCGQTITKKKVSHCGAQKKVRWSCLGGHRGVWMSSPHLWEAFPEIHLLTTLSILFSGATFTHFKKWAKHLHLNFMGNKTFFEIQKAYLNTETKQQLNSTEQETNCVTEDQQKPEGSLLHIADNGCYVSPEPISTRSEQYHLKKIKTKLRRREKGTLSSQSSYKERFPISRTSTEADVQERSAPSSCGHVSTSEKGEQRQQDNVQHPRTTTHKVLEVNCQNSFEEMEITIKEDEEEEYNSVHNRVSELESDMENVSEATELRAAEADDNWDEDVYVPVIPQRSTTSALLLECEEEELEPWQRQTLQVDLKDEDDVRELKSDCKLEPSTPPDTVNTSPELETETPQRVVFNSPGLIVASPQLTRSTEFTGSLGTHCPPGSSLTVVPGKAVHEHLLHKVTRATVKPETYSNVSSSDVEQISNNPPSLSSFQAPAVYATSSDLLQFNQSNPSNPCFPYLKLNQMAHKTNNK
ncbi:THAP domain-containing protein 4 [Channa argus]|uniref:THAP domain-containing protein 4 n=1 Tax=Channa argus TaxID=215402 RepID=A0A6G1P803_CHAAH|nr:THAP domain-containing protein 4 [Channa argus]